MIENLAITKEEYKNLVLNAHNPGLDVREIGHAPAGSTVTFRKDGSVYECSFKCATHPEDVDRHDRHVVRQIENEEGHAKFTVYGLFSAGGHDYAPVSEDILMNDFAYTVLDIVEITGDTPVVNVEF